jgi:D-alanine-D-alanine ligase
LAYILTLSHAWQENNIRIGIAYDLRSDFQLETNQPDDSLEEYDSEETIEALSGVFRRAGHEPVKLGGGLHFLNHFVDGSTGGTRLDRPPVDLVFNMAEGHGSRSREAHVPAVCEMFDLPYTHSDPLALALSLDKALCKRVVASYGVPVATSVVIEDIEDLKSTALPPFPVLVKPAWGGSSMGIRSCARCTSKSELTNQVSALLSGYRQPALIEPFLSGAEVTVGILGTGTSARVVGMMEIAPRSAARDVFLYSLEAKRNYREEVEYHLPPRLAPQMGERISQAALAAYRALGCRDIGRVDLRMDSDGQPFFMEINPIPGLHPVDGDFPILWRRLGGSYDELILAVLESSAARWGSRIAAS